MRKRYQAAALALGSLLMAGGFAGYRYVRRERQEQLHYERAETEVILSNTTSSSVELFRADRSPREAVELPVPPDRRVWLPEGRYFFRANHAPGPVFYPVPVLGYRSGPDREGDIDITVRPLPPRRPPRLLPELPDFVYIPSGPFVIGDRLNPREPHYVWLTGFFMSPCEVTNAEFREFLRDTGAPRTQASARMSPADSDYGRFGRPELPVTGVSWLEASAFCRWLTTRLGGNEWIFALPNDAEWEKAARGPDSFDYSLGMTISDAEIPLYNWKKNPDVPVTVVSCRDSGFQPNRYGLYHMSGNVAEWTQSVFRHYNRQAPYTDDDRNHDSTVGRRTVRGGSWYSATSAPLYVPYRDSFQPEHAASDVGFRIVARARP